MKSSLWDEREGQDILLSSDGRNDSPGRDIVRNIVPTPLQT